MIWVFTSMSLSLKIISLVSLRKPWLDRVSVVRHSTPTHKMILSRTSVAILISLAISSN